MDSEVREKNISLSANACLCKFSLKAEEKISDRHQEFIPKWRKTRHKSVAKEQREIFFSKMCDGANEPWVKQHYYVILWSNINLLRYTNLSSKMWNWCSYVIEHTDDEFLWRQSSVLIELPLTTKKITEKWSIKIIALANLYEFNSFFFILS